MSSLQNIQAEQVTPQAWRNGGGQTRELLAWPSATDWKLRISRADIAADGPFSAFEGVQRWFVVLSGAGVVLHLPDSGRSGAVSTTQDYRLQPGHRPFTFDGGMTPGCTLIDGPTQDFNLMARGGRALVRPVQAGKHWSEAFAMRGLYTATAGEWKCGPLTRTLAAHSLLWLPEGGADAMTFASDPHAPLSAWWLGYTPETSL